MKDKIFFGLVGLFILLLFFRPDYDYRLLNKGIYFHHLEDYGQLKELAEKSNVLFYKRSPYSSITVTEQKEFFGTEADKPTYFETLKKLRINGKIQCGTGKFDITTTTLQAALPLLLHKEPRNALNIGIGCGLTQGVLNIYPLESIDAIEVDPAVLEASEYFNDVHNNALKDSRVNVIVADARNFLLTSDKKYDIIVNTPSHPWSSPSNNLFTKEFFEMLNEHIEEDGLVVQWYASLSSSRRSFKVFYKTFSEVFPHIVIFSAKVPKANYRFFKNGSFEIYYQGFEQGELIVIGSKSPIKISEKSFAGTELEKYLKIIHFTKLSDYYVADGEDLENFAVDSKYNTDDKPVLEFLSSQSLYSDSYGRVIKEIQDYLKRGAE